MAKRGPKPKPTAYHKLAGNPGKRAYNEAEPDYGRTAPTCPRHLGKEAKAEWKRLAKMLSEAGTLTRADRAVMAGYCEAWGLYVKASADVQKYGAVLISPKSKMPFCSPYVSILSMALKQMNTFAAELGLTPSSRSRVTATKPQAPEGKGRFLKVVG